MTCIYTGQVDVETDSVVKYYDAARALEIQELLEAISMAIRER